MRVIVVERAPGLRGAGQSIDLRGAGREVVRRMGLEDAVRGAGTGEEGIAFVDERGRTRAALGVDAFGGEGFTAELEILRGSLVELLYGATRDDVEYVFDDHVTGIENHADGARVHLAGGASHDVDVVVGADGIGSAVRRQIFGEGWIRSLGLSIAYMTIPTAPQDSFWAREQNAPGARSVLLRPDRLGGTARALLSFLTEPCMRSMDVAGQKDLLRRRFAGVGGLVPRVLDAIGPAEEFYAEDVGQVRMPAWSSGRVALLGDAGYCASPVSGMGTSLALVGGYVLAGALAENADPAAAFAAYEQRLRPYVAQAQKLPPGAPRITLPRTRAGIGVLHTIARAASTRPVGALLSRVASPPADRITLPDHGDVRV